MVWRTGSFVALLIAILLLALIVPNFSQPAQAVSNGKIAFVSDRDGDSAIYVMNADGTGQKRLTNDTHGDVEPAFSPYGTKIAFSSNRDGILEGDPQNYEIYVMNIDGSNQQRRTNNTAGDENPAWSHDGTKIVFERPGGNAYVQIFVTSAAVCD